ncbi:MAG: alpha/beta fold hydrolase [Deltaproteobacteria bacterium]|nr:alpha/beta fold hydrolase [Deltaproteobacteria bacterium]
MSIDILQGWTDAAEALRRGLPWLPALAEVAPTPHQVLDQRNKARLLRYRRATAPRWRTPVLLVPSFINRAYILDLTRGFSLVQHLLDRGLDVFMIDWGVPGDEDRLIAFDDMIEPMLARAVRVTCRAAAIDRVAIVGYCMGGTLAICHAALHPERIALLVNMLGPVDFEQAGMLGDWTDPRRFDPDLLADAYGNMPPLLMQYGFQMLRPLAALSKLVKSLGGELDPDAARFFDALDRWSWDNIPFPGDAYRRYVRELYQRNALFRGTLQIRGRLVDPRRIRCPVLTLCADQDHINPPAAARALGSLLDPATAYDEICIKGGHVSAVVGPRGQKELWPALSSWLERTLAI